jgi:hypothetical protein
MRIDKLLRERIASDPRAFGLFKPVTADDIHIILRTSPVQSATGRIHCEVYVGSGPYPAIIAQVVPLAGIGSTVDRSPYYPQGTDVASQLVNVLPSPAGEITDGRRRLYWARYVPWPSLQDNFHDLIPYVKLMSRLRQPPWNRAAEGFCETQKSDDLLAEYVSMAHCVCSLWDELRPYESDLTASLQQCWRQLKLGFSHGDLWCQDVLYSASGQLCILDWEWSAAARPMGTDLFHFSLSTISIYYRIPFSEALTCLTWGEGEIERLSRQQLCLLWDELCYDAEIRYLSVLTYLIYIEHRITLQSVRSLPYGYDGTAPSLAAAMASPTYLTRLVGGKNALAKGLG